MSDPLFDPSTDDAPISDETQKIVNEPIVDPTGLDDKDQELVNMIASLVDEGKINLYQPSSMVNQEVYDNLDRTQQGKIDQQAFNMLTTVRNIYSYNQSDFTNSTYQFQNMVHTFRLQKEKSEEEFGDVYKF